MISRFCSNCCNFVYGLTMWQPMFQIKWNAQMTPVYFSTSMGNVVQLLEWNSFLQFSRKFQSSMQRLAPLGLQTKFQNFGSCHNFLLKLYHYNFPSFRARIIHKTCDFSCVLNLRPSSSTIHCFWLADRKLYQKMRMSTNASDYITFLHH